MMTVAMIAILAHGVELLLTLVTRILKQSRKVFALHMLLTMDLLRAHMSTNVALKLSKVNSFTNLFKVVVQVKIISPFLTEILIACILVHLLNRGLGGVHQLTGFWFPLGMYNVHSSNSMVILRCWQGPLLFSL